MDTPLVRVGAKDPNRCQANNGQGPCSFGAVPGGKNCYLHGGAQTALANDRKELKNFKLRGLLAERAGELANSSNLKDLTDELALNRALMETLSNQIETPEQVMIFSDKIGSLISKSQSLVQTIQKIQEKNRELIDRPTLFAILQDIVGVIVGHISDPEAQRIVGEEVYECIIKRLGGAVPN